MAKRVVGVDISSRRILAVELGSESRHQVTLKRHASIDLPPGAARDGDVIDSAAVSAALSELWRRGGFSTKRVIFGAGNQRVLVRTHTVPQLPLREVRQSLKFQVADLLPVPVSETILDFYPIEAVDESSPPQMRGLLVAALRENIETNVLAFEDAGLTVVGVDLSPFAMVRALRVGGALAGTHAVVMIGTRTTFVVVATDGVPHFVRIIPAGSENVIDSVEDAIGGSREEIARTIADVGLARAADPQHAAASEAMLRGVNSLANSVRNTNSYYAGAEPGVEIASVILLGADTRHPGFAEALAEGIGLPTVLGDALGMLRNRSAAGIDDPLLEADLAIPLGLALEGR